MEYDNTNRASLWPHKGKGPDMKGKIEFGPDLVVDFVKQLYGDKVGEKLATLTAGPNAICDIALWNGDKVIGGPVSIPWKRLKELEGKEPEDDIPF